MLTPFTFSSEIIYKVFSVVNAERKVCPFQKTSVKRKEHVSSLANNEAQGTRLSDVSKKKKREYRFCLFGNRNERGDVARGFFARDDCLHAKRKI